MTINEIILFEVFFLEIDSLATFFKTRLQKFHDLLGIFWHLIKDLF